MSDVLMRFGGSVKQADGKPEGFVEGYLVRFTNAEQPDLTGSDFFDASTDYGVDIPERGDGTKSIDTIGLPSPVWYGHGLDTTMDVRRLGQVKMVKDDVGIWVEGQMALRDDYENAIYGMVKDKKLGWSSGAPAHLVRRKKVEGKNATHITCWPLGGDASLTPTPAEFRNSAFTKAMPVDSIKGLLRRTYEDDVDTNDPFNGIGMDLTAAGLRSLSDRLCYSLYDLLMEQDPGKSIDDLSTQIDRFATLAKQYVKAVIQSLTMQQRDMEAKHLKSLLAGVTVESAHSAQNNSEATIANQSAALQELLREATMLDGKSLTLKSSLLTLA